MHPKQGFSSVKNIGHFRLHINQKISLMLKLRNMEALMQELYSALALLKITHPDRPRNAREEEDRFYAEAAQASALWRWVKAVMTYCSNAMKNLVQQHEKRSDRTCRNQAQAEGVDSGVIGGASNRDGAGGFSGHHHERLPERET